MIFHFSVLIFCSLIDVYYKGSVLAGKIQIVNISLRNIYGSTINCVDAFRIALTEEPKLLIKQKYS